MSECEGCSFPTTGEMVKNFTLSMANVLTHAIKTGKARASEDEITKRTYICEACPMKQGARCVKCGCVLVFKIGLDSEKCPMGKW